MSSKNILKNTESSIYVDIKTRSKLGKIAKKNNRSSIDQIRHWIKQEEMV